MKEDGKSIAMYQPPPLREDRKEIMHELMRLHPFATLISIKDSDICADHLPLLVHCEVSRYGTVRGHVAKGNPLWRSEIDGAGALAIFQGPQAYWTCRPREILQALSECWTKNRWHSGSSGKQARR